MCGLRFDSIFSTPSTVMLTGGMGGWLGCLIPLLIKVCLASCLSSIGCSWVNTDWKWRFNSTVFSLSFDISVLCDFRVGTPVLSFRACLIKDQNLFDTQELLSLLSLGDLSIETVLIGTTVYAIHVTKFRITSSVIPKSKSKPQPLFFRKQVICKQGSDVSPVHADDLFEKVTCFK